EAAAADRRNERDLVAVPQLLAGLGVGAVDRVEEAVGLDAELELRPDVADVRDAVDLPLRPAGLLAESGEEADADAHASMLRAGPFPQDELDSSPAAAPSATPGGKGAGVIPGSGPIAGMIPPTPPPGGISDITSRSGRSFGSSVSSSSSGFRFSSVMFSAFPGAPRLNPASRTFPATSRGGRSSRAG